MGTDTLRNYYFVFTITCLLLAWISFGNERRRIEVPNHNGTVIMASVGDSIMSGVFAKSEGYKVLQSMQTSDGRPQKILYGFISQPEYNWVDGDKIRSHKVMLEERGYKVVSHNFSWPAHTSYDVLNYQIPTLSEYYEKLNINAFDTLIVSIGSNDICSDKPEEMTPEAVFKGNMEEILRRVYARSYIVVPLPDYSQLRDMAKYKLNKIGIPSWLLWRIMGTCPTLTRDKYKHNAQDQIYLYNKAMKELVAKLQKENPSRDYYYADGMEETAFDITMINRWDMFHPSRQGQEEIARKTFVWNNLFEPQ
jgi:lysophospholipase L1-like esterase